MDIQKTNSNEDKVANQLDSILGDASPEFGKVFIMAARYPDIEWQITWTKEMKETPLKFSCHIYAASVKVAFYKVVGVSYALPRNIINCCHFNHVVG